MNECWFVAPIHLQAFLHMGDYRDFTDTHDRKYHH